MSIPQIKGVMAKAGMDDDGKMQLFNGETGEPFKEKTMV
jgi:DNA-directed RNA polymerase beta subunit